MNLFIKTLFVLFIFIATAFKPDTQQNLLITFTGLADTKSAIIVSLYKPGAKFPSKKGAFRRIKLTLNGEASPTLTVKDLPYGSYAVSCYQDLDGNDIMTTNFMHIPKEPTGFSNNAKHGMFPPSFDDSKFNYSEKEFKQSIKLNK
ncbi:MAG: DUF2141 domain-containing protein [Bacteroidetes bacterium]|nr:DUF2141 domain-containing protein [Bacteroidota bacterium]